MYSEGNKKRWHNITRGITSFPLADLLSYYKLLELF